MQQQSVSWQSLTDCTMGAAIVPRQQQIKTDRMGRHSRHRHHIQAILTSTIGNCSIDAIDPVREFRGDARRVSTGNFQLIDLQWQTAFKLHCQPLENLYVIHLVIVGKLDCLLERQSSRSSITAKALIYSPGSPIETISSDAGHALLVTIDRAAVDATASKLLARPIKQPVIFEPNIDLAGDVGASLKQFARFIWEAATTNTERASDFSSLMLQKLEQTFLDCAIAGLPSNYTDELSYRADGALACHVRKAQAFIDSHLGEKIELGDIAAATQICPRLLQKAFAVYCNRSPMRFLMETRLQRIRQELERGNSETKIVDVMMNYGFTQGGKFAKEYQQLFGEKPSDTLKRVCQMRQQQRPLWHEINDELSAQIQGGRQRELGVSGYSLVSTSSLRPESTIQNLIPRLNFLEKVNRLEIL